MDSESGIMDRYFRNASPQRLILYGVVVVGIIVALILVFTLLFSSDNTTPSPTPKPAHQFNGRDVLTEVPLVDGYNNLPVKLIAELKGKINDFPFEKDLSSIKGYSWAKTDIPKLKSGQVGSQFWTIKTTCTSQFKDTVANTLQQIDAISRLTLKYKDNFKLVSSSNDVNDIFKEKKIGSILGIDGGHSIDNKLSVLRLYYRLGVRYLTLTSECDTPWSSSYATSKTPSLSAFGEIVVKEMNRLGMMIDISKSNVEVQKTILDTSKAPVIFSSSNLYSIVKKVPNVQDEILEKLKKNNGLIMIAFNPDNMRKDSKDVVTIEHVVEQITYVAKKIGVDYVGIGSGFGTVDTIVKDLEDSSKFPELFDRLAKPQGDELKWGKEELEKLAYGNFYRVFEEVEKVKEETAANEDLIPASDIPEGSKSCYTALQLYNTNAANAA